MMREQGDNPFWLLEMLTTSFQS